MTKSLLFFSKTELEFVAFDFLIGKSSPKHGRDFIAQIINLNQADEINRSLVVIVSQFEIKLRSFKQYLDDLNLFFGNCVMKSSISDRVLRVHINYANKNLNHLHFAS